MTLDKQSTIDEVRSLTGYSELVLSDPEIGELMETAKRDIQSTTENYDLNWYDTTDLDPNRALMWTTCLFCLLKAREVDGVEFELESLRQETIRAAGSSTQNAPMWYTKAQDYVQRLDASADDDWAYGVVSAGRENRTYGEDDTGGPSLG